MTDITLRQVKGAPLTYDELDANFANLKETADLAYDAVAGVGGKANAAALGTDDAALDMGSTTVEFLTDNGTAKEWIEELGNVVGLRSPWVYASRAEAEGVNVPSVVKTISVLSGDRILNYVRDAAGTALTTGDGQTWSPAGKWTYEHFGSDGVDDTAAFVALHASINGQVLSLEKDKEYIVDVSTTRTWNTPFILEANGATFRFDGASNGWGVTAAAFIQGDHLDVTFTVTGADRATQRGLWFLAGCDFDRIKVIGEAGDEYGSGNTNAGAVRIAPLLADAAYMFSRVGRIETKGFVNPLYFARLENSVFGYIKCDTYRRALYLSDVKNFDIHGGHAFGASSVCTGAPGENGILIEAVEADFASKNIRINNFTAEDSGEHGFRVGGQKIIKGVWYTNCQARNTGAGVGAGVEPDDHGGCGFKVLGPTTVSGARHQDIFFNDCSVVDVKLDNGSFRLNFAGFYMGKVYGGAINNCIVMATIPSDSYSAPAGYSCENGIEIIGCENIEINNPDIAYPRNSGVYISDAEDSVGVDWGLNTSIKINGGSIRVPGVAALEVVAGYKTCRRVAMDGTLVDGGQYVVKATASGAGSFTGCSAGFTCWTQSVETVNGTTGWTITAKGTMAGSTTTGNACKAGSTFLDWTAGIMRVRDGSMWTSPSGSFVVSVADDAFFTWTPKAVNMWVMVSCSGSAYYGQAWVRPTATPLSVKVNGGASFATLNSALTGTTGTDGNLTLGTQNNAMYIENRTGSTQSITITQLA